MVTRFYFHNALSSIGGTLPTTSQSSLTLTLGVDAFTVNRSMDTTIGTSQSSKSRSTNAVTTTQNLYFTKFVSPALGAQTISANTWTYYFGVQESNTSANFPTSGINGTVRVCIYLWRPSTGTKVGNILDGNSTASFWEPQSANTEFPSGPGNFSGSSVVAQDGDVIIQEIWFTVTQATATAYTDIFYYDGTGTVGQSSASSQASTAAYVETPQTLTWSNPLRNLTQTIGESLAFSGSHDRKRGLLQAVGPALTISDSENRYRGKPKTVSDSVTITSVVPRLRGFIQFLSDSLTLSDTGRSRLKGSVRTISEAQVFTAVIPKIRNLLRTDPTETLSLTDSLSRLRGRKAVNPETLSLSAVNNRIKNVIKTVSNPLTITAVNVKIRSIFRSVSSNTLSLSDIMTTGGSNLRIITDIISFTDLSTKTKQTMRTFSDTISSFTDTQSRMRGKIRIAGEVFGESFPLTTSTLVKATTRLRSISQALNIVDLLVVLRLKNKTIAEPLTFTDLENISKLKLKTMSDSIAISESVPFARFRGFNKILSSNNLSLAQIINKVTTRLRTLSEVLGLGHLTSKLKNGGTLSPTRLYFHNALTTVTGLLPSTNQSNLAIDYNVDALTTNRSMSTALGTGGQVSISKTINSTFNITSNYYLTRFISPPLGQFSIAANTWKYSISAVNAGTSNVDKAPTRTDTNPGPININVYVWRPSTGAKVGTIKDGDTSNVIQYTSSLGVQRTAFATFTGASVANMQMTDVLVVECWMHISNHSAGDTVPTFYYDGSVVTLTDGATVTNHASFIETPESFSFNILRNLAKSLASQPIAFLASSPVRIRGFIQLVNDTLSLTDTQSRKTTRLRTILPTLSLSESITRRKPTVLKSISHIISFVDSPVKFATKIRALSDSLSFIDIFFKGKTGEHNRVISHILKLSDTTTKTANIFKAFYIRLLRLRGNK